ncbi:MAG: hypothetical protein HY722_02930 [Planctomycetes bacterium]|nr:hypothetical protein [Planctomycetota bacterium]
MDEITSLRQELRRVKKANPQTGAMRSIAGLEEKVIQLDQENRIEYLNSALVATLGVSRDDLIGKDLRAIDRFEWGPGLLAKLVEDSRERKAPVEALREHHDKQRDETLHLKIRVDAQQGKPQILIEDVTELRNLEEMFGAYVSPAVLEKMKASRRDFFKAERARMTVVFADLRGFTAMSENMEPEEVRRTLNEYLETMTEIILVHEGTVDKYVGDEIMALFGRPIPMEDHAYKAVLVALEMQEAQRRLVERWTHEGRASVHMGMGINTGEMIIGNIGSKRKMNYTVLGHHVNLAARLCSNARAGQILISQGTFDELMGHTESAAIKERIGFDIIDRIEAKGISHPVEVFNVAPR